jgi:hypothetical protein
MDADPTSLEAQVNRLQEELRSLRVEVEKLKSTVGQITSDAVEAQRALAVAPAQTKFAWMAPLIRRIENLEKRAGTGSLGH